MKVLTSKSYSNLMANIDDLKPLWLLAREIAISKEYNESYKNTAEGIEILGSDTYAIKNIKAALKTDYTQTVIDMYLDIFAEDIAVEEVLSKCLAIEALLADCSDLITFNDEIIAVSNFCKSTIEKLKKDIGFYNGVLEDSAEALTALAEELKNANREKLLERYEELHALYLSSSLAQAAPESTVELYKEITLKYRIFCSANECVKSMAAMIEGYKITADELYERLCGINYFLEFADKNDEQVKSAVVIYQQKLNEYNQKYISHNETVDKLNEFAGGVCLSNIITPEDKD